jgi:hypothetical protein
MLGERHLLNSSDWLSKLKVAIVREDFDSLQTLTAMEIEFQNLQELEDAKYLLKETLMISARNRDSIQQSLSKVKRNIEITRSTLSTPFHKIDKSF